MYADNCIFIPIIEIVEYTMRIISIYFCVLIKIKLKRVHKYFHCSRRHLFKFLLFTHNITCISEFNEQPQTNHFKNRIYIYMFVYTIEYSILK